MSLPEDEPQWARPVGVPIVARPVASYTARPAPSVYPMLDTSRGHAVLDIVLISVATVLAVDPCTVAAIYLEAWSPSLGIFWQNLMLGIVTLLVLGVLMYLRRQPPRTIGLGPIRVRHGLIGAFLGIPACYMAAISAAALYALTVGMDMDSILEERQGLMEMIPEPSLATFLAMSVFPGIHEEILFRGFLLSRLSTIFRSRVAGIIVSSIIFGLPHAYQGGMGVFQTAALGAVFATMATLTKSLWPSILAHGLFNGISISLSSFLQDQMQMLQDQVTTTSAGM